MVAPAISVTLSGLKHVSANLGTRKQCQHSSRFDSDWELLRSQDAKTYEARTLSRGFRVYHRLSNTLTKKIKKNNHC